MIDETDEYNTRLLARMRLAVEACRHSISLTMVGRTISDLEALGGCLRQPNGAWFEQFQRQWGVLEEVYSVALVESRPRFDPDELASIERTCESLLDTILQFTRGSVEPR